jgi:hypothetical protein
MKKRLALASFLSFSLLASWGGLLVGEEANSEPRARLAITAGDAVASRAGAVGATRGWPQTTNGAFASPVLYDLDGNGSLEVISADEYEVRVYDQAGRLWPGWPRHFPGFGPQEHVAVTDLDGDGQPEILAAVATEPPKIYAFEIDGSLVPGWPASITFHTLLNITCPVVTDLDGDGSPDVGVAGEDGIFFFRADGTPLPGWPYRWQVGVNNPQWSAPAVGDLDGDGTLEVAVGTAVYPDPGIHVVHANGTPVAGWPKITGKPMLSSPALADLDGDGKLEVIEQEGDPGSQGSLLWVLRHDATDFPGWPLAIAAEGWSSRSSPAVADVDGDGSLEIVAATGDGNLHVLRPDGTYYSGYPRQTGGTVVLASPVVIDVDGDGVEEIFLTYTPASSPNEQVVSGWRLDGTTFPSFPRVLVPSTTYASHASVQIADTNGDGDLELATAGTGDFSGSLWVFRIRRSVFDPGSTRRDWPKIRRDAENTGCFTGS